MVQKPNNRGLFLHRNDVNQLTVHIYLHLVYCAQQTSVYKLTCIPYDRQSSRNINTANHYDKKILLLKITKMTWHLNTTIDLTFFRVAAENDIRKYNHFTFQSHYIIILSKGRRFEHFMLIVVLYRFFIMMYLFLVKYITDVLFIYMLNDALL